MTEKLYDSQRYAREFTANVQSVSPLEKEGQWAVVLDRTLFYPEGGGQPADRGSLAGLPVSDVQLKDGRIVHVVSGAAPQGEVKGLIDWERRFDHMQQHTGEHLLLGAFFRLFQANSCGFHLGEQVSHLDLDRTELSPDEIFQAETLANEMIFANRTVNARLLAEDEEMPEMRKKPTKAFQALRVVEVEDFDRCPCGGTHVEKSGEVGLVKIIGQERKKGRLRLFYLAGKRALLDYERKNRDLTAIGALVSMPPTESLAAVEKQQDKMMQLNQRHAQLQSRLAELLAEQLLQAGEELGELRLVVHAAAPEDGELLDELSRQLTQREKALFLLAGEDPRSGRKQLFFGRSADVTLDMKQLLAAVQKQRGGKGGGTPNLVRLQCQEEWDMSELLEMARQEALKLAAQK